MDLHLTPWCSLSLIKHADIAICMDGPPRTSSHRAPADIHSRTRAEIHTSDCEMASASTEIDLKPLVRRCACYLCTASSIAWCSSIQVCPRVYAAAHACAHAPASIQMVWLADGVGLLLVVTVGCAGARVRKRPPPASGPNGYACMAMPHRCRVNCLHAGETQTLACFGRNR